MSEADYRFLEEQRLSPSSAATMLGISRQAVYAGLSRAADYFDGKRREELLGAIERAHRGGSGSPQTGGDLSPKTGLCTVSFGRSIDVLLAQDGFRSFIGGASTQWQLYCAILADREAADTVANAVQNAMRVVGRGAQAVAPRAMVFKSNIARVVPAMALYFDADNSWHVRTNPTVHGQQDTTGYCNALMLTLAACGLTFVPDTRSLEFSSTCQGRTDGLYLELVLDTETTNVSSS